MICAQRNHVVQNTAYTVHHHQIHTYLFAHSHLSVQFLFYIVRSILYRSTFISSHIRVNLFTHTQFEVDEMHNSIITFRSVLINCRVAYLGVSVIGLYLKIFNIIIHREALSDASYNQRHFDKLSILWAQTGLLFQNAPSF